MTTKIHRISDTAFALQIGQTAYSLSTSVRTSGDTTIFNTARNPNWEYAYQNVLGKRIVPYGPGNDMPVMVRDLVQDNNLAPGILQRQKGLLYGQGAFLYRYIFQDGKIARQYDDDPEISGWLRSWQAEKFIEKALVDHLHMQGFFALHFMERARRLGARAVDHLGRKARIAKLQFVKSTNARLEWTDSRSHLEYRPSPCTIPSIRANTPYPHPTTILTPSAATSIRHRHFSARYAGYCKAPTFR